MSSNYHHGVRVVEKDSGTRPIRTVDSAIIGVVGTAPGAQAARAATLTIGTGNSALTLSAKTAGAAGNRITLRLLGGKGKTLSAALSGNTITVQLATSNGGVVTTSAAELKTTINAAGDDKPGSVITATLASGSDGSGKVPLIAKALAFSGGEDEAFPLNTPVLIAGSRQQAAKLGLTGTLPQAMDAIFDQIAALIVVVRVGFSETENTQISNIIGTVDAAGQYTGLQALLAAQARLGVKPRILGAPGFSHHVSVAAELGAIADKLRAFAYIDAPVGTAEAAVNYRNLFGNKRLMLLWPGFKVWDTSAAGTVSQPASARALGLRARLDNLVGWHKVISNIPVNGVAGLTADVDWDLQNPNTKAGYLNANEVSTLIAHQGFRFWGSRTCSGDPKFAFESAVRTGDILADTIAEGHAWAVDKPMSQMLIDDIIEGVNAKFRELKANGYIVNAACYLDPELNDKESRADGKLWLNYDYTPVPPLEQLGFHATITNRYLIELLPSTAAA